MFFGNNTNPKSTTTRHVTWQGNTLTGKPITGKTFTYSSGWKIGKTSIDTGAHARKTTKGSTEKDPTSFPYSDVCDREGLSDD